MKMRFNAETMNYELISDEQGAFNKREVLYSGSKEAIASLFSEKVMGIDPLVHKTGIELGLDNRQNIIDFYLFDGKGKVSQHFSSAQLSSAPFSAEEISASFKKLREDGYTKLTEKENKFLVEFLEENDCGANTASELLQDNHSCQCIEDLTDVMEKSPQEIGGYISSLMEKGVIVVEERDNEPFSGEVLPNLYWVETSFLEEMKERGLGNKPFAEIDISVKNVEQIYALDENGYRSEEVERELEEQGWREELNNLIDFMKRENILESFHEEIENIGNEEMSSLLEDIGKGNGSPIGFFEDECYLQYDSAVTDVDWGEISEKWEHFLSPMNNQKQEQEQGVANALEGLKEVDYNKAKDGIVTLINGEVGKLLSEEAIEALWVVNRELIELRSNSEFPEQTHTVEISDYAVLIDGKIISDEVLSEVLEYSLVDRDALIEELQRMLGEALQGNRTNDANLIEQDIDELKELTNLSDEFVFSSQITNEYISFTNNPEQFNELCQMALDEQEKIDLGKIPFSRLDAEDIIVSHPLYDTIEGIYKPEVLNNLPDVKYLLNNYDIGNAKDYRMDMKNNNDVLDWDTFIKQVDDFIDKNGIPEEKRTTKKKPKGARP